MFQPDGRRPSGRRVVEEQPLRGIAQRRNAAAQIDGHLPVDHAVISFAFDKAIEPRKRASSLKDQRR